MSWLELLALDLDGDMPVMVLDLTIPPGVWWNDDSMPFVHVSLCSWDTVWFQLLAAFGCASVMFEGDA